MARPVQLEISLADAVIVECWACRQTVKVRRGETLHRYWHCDPTPPSGAETAKHHNALAGIEFPD